MVTARRAGLRSAVPFAAAIIVRLMGGPSPAAGATLTLSGDAGAPPGVPAVVRLSIDDAGGMLGTDLVVTYDPAVVAALSVATTGLSASQTLFYTVAQPGLIRIALYGAEPLNGSGDLLAITFAASGPSGSRTDLRIVSADLNEGGISATMIDGRFCVTGTGEEVGGLIAAPVPGSTASLLSWSGHPFADDYNLYRATRPDIADLACLIAPIAATQAIDDGLAPAAGGLFVYVITGNLCGGETSAGADSDGVERVVAAPCF